MEDMLFNWDPMDIISKRGKYMLSNTRRVGLGHRTARLDQFILHNDFLLENLLISSHIIPSIIYDQKPISLVFHPLEYIFPIV
jgi:hypothetical protein